jgi:hypothetical protein
VEVFDSSNSKLADISEIVYKENGAAEERSNIFDSEAGVGLNESKTKTEAFNFDKPDNDKPGAEAAKYSPSRISKYKPNPAINNEFAHSYLDDANKFNEHEFRRQVGEGGNIKFEEVNDDFN